jgi:hypothetical protein
MGSCGFDAAPTVETSDNAITASSTSLFNISAKASKRF